MNKKYKNKKDNILALNKRTSYDFMNRMINTPIMTESKLGLVNSLTTSIYTRNIIQF